MRTRALALLVLVAIAVGVIALGTRGGGPLVVSGFVEADEIRVGSRVGGRVLAVRAAEGDRVAAGAVLVELEPYDLFERRAQAAARVAAAEARLARLEAGNRAEEIAQAAAREGRLAARLAELETGPRAPEIAAARARLALAEAERELAEQDYARAETLAAERVASQRELDQARSRRRVAEATVAVRREELELLLEGTRAEEIAQAQADLEEARQAHALARAGARPEDVDEARAQLAAERAALAALERQADELVVRAPIDAVVDALDLEPGDLLAPDAPALTLLDLERRYVRAFVPQNRVAVRPGDDVELTVDAFGAERFEGRVTFVAREAEFTPSNAQTSEERAKLVFRIEVDLLEGAERVRPGMSADVHLERAGGE